MYVLGFDSNVPLNFEKYREFKKKGYSFVGRYYTNEAPSKLLTRQDAEIISKSGLKIVAIFENSITRLDNFTYDRGRTDLLKAVVRAIEIGQPDNSTIYFTVNFGATAAHLPQIGEYFKGICEEMKEFTLKDSLQRHWDIGVYGSYSVVNYINLNLREVPYIWQTYSWSYGKVHSNCNIYQYKNNVNILGEIINNNKGKTTRVTKIGSFSVNK